MKKVRGERKKLVRFGFKKGKGSVVCVAGSFNNWNPSADRLDYKGGEYSTVLPLPSGRHEYKFVVDGVWCADPGCADWVPDGFGSINSVLTVVDAKG